MIEDAIIAISRLVKDSTNSNKESYQPNAALQSVKVNIQPASPEQTMMVEGVFFQTYLGFTTTSGILQGDHVTVSGTGQKYTIKGIEDWTKTDLIPHYELLMVEASEEQLLI